MAPGLFPGRVGAAQVGVRPKDLAVEPDAAGPARIAGVEPLGGYTVLTITAAGGATRAPCCAANPPLPPASRCA